MKSSYLHTITALVVAGVYVCSAFASLKELDWISNAVAADKRHGGRLCSLLAVGGFRADVADNFSAVRDTWLSKHPSANLTLVCEYSSEGGKKLTLSYVWISDKRSNLNVELVRQGCVASDYMHVPADQRLHVARSVYERFVEQVRAAEKEAKAHRIGTWGVKSSSNSDE